MNLPQNRGRSCHRISPPTRQTQGARGGQGDAGTLPDGSRLPSAVSSLLYTNKNRRSKGPAVDRSAAEDAVEESLELSAAHGMLQLANRLGFNLPDALAGHLEDAPDLLERVRVPVAQAV